MSDGERSFSMSVPVDSDGFLRRECPTCEREFKWFASPEGEGEPVPEGGYYCPYCEIQAPASAWLTKAQVAQAESVIAREVVEPELKNFGDTVSRLGESSGGLVEGHVEITTPEEPPPLSESDDMRRVDVECHPSEPVKVLDDWDRAVHCLICGKPASG